VLDLGEETKEQQERARALKDRKQEATQHKHDKLKAAFLKKMLKKK
jgi:hypothetical protein